MSWRFSSPSDRATQLTHQLLAFSRKQMLQPAPLDLNVVLADLMRMLGRLLGEDIELAIRHPAWHRSHPR